MTIRVEFGRSRSRRYEAAVRFCRRFPRYLERGGDSEVIHAVEIHSSDRQAWAALMRFVGGWRSTRCFVNDQEVEGKVESSAASDTLTGVAQWGNARK